MKILTLFVALVAIAFSAPAFAIDIGGADVTSIGKPECVEKNPSPRYTKGEFFSEEHGSYTTPEGQYITDPFWQWGDFAGVAPYSALVGGTGDGSVAVYRHATAQTELNIIWGSPDRQNTLELIEGTTAVVTINGAQLARRFNSWGHTLNLDIVSPKPWHVLRLRAANVAFEYNIAGCSQQK